MLEELLTTKLKTVTPQAFPLKAPEKVTGAHLIYQRTGTARETHLDGPGGIAVVNFRVDCYQTSYSKTNALADALRASCDGWREGDVLYCSVDNDIDFGAEPDADGYYRRSLELRVTYRES
jgi:hypothetical protein